MSDETPKPCPHMEAGIDWSQLYVGRKAVRVGVNVSYYEVRRKMRGYGPWIPACKITAAKVAHIESLVGGKVSVLLRALADLAEEVGE